MKKPIFQAIKLTFILLVFFSGVYTCMVWGVAQMVPFGGRGERIVDKGQTFYANVGQAFTEDRYFNSRPSAVGYNAAGSGGSNKGPSNPAYLQEVQARIDTFRMHNPEAHRALIPVELVTASGSGLDPDLSPEAALLQIRRISSVRHLPPEIVVKLVKTHTEGPLWGMFGPEKVNVLKLNIALDEMQGK